MSSQECRKIERQLHTVLRGLTSGSNDAYETEFPLISHSPHQCDRINNACVSQQMPSRLCNAAERNQNSLANRKNMRWRDDKFHFRDDDFQEHNVRRRKGQTTKSKVETNRQFVGKKKVVDRRIDDKSEFGDLSLQSGSLLRNKLQGKQIHVLTSEDIELEESISNDQSKKFNKSFKHPMERRKHISHSKPLDDKKIQANIFRSALSEASSSGETTSRKDKMKKLSEDNLYFETEGTSHTYEDVLHQSSSETYLTTDSNAESRKVVSSDKVLRNIPQKHPIIQDPIDPSLSEKLSKAGMYALSGDEFIGRCNKESCHCLEDSLYCTLCDFHIDNQKELERHKKQISHEVRKKDYFRVKGLEALIPPSKCKLTAIDKLLHKIYITHVQRTEDDQLRRALIKQLRNDLSSEIEEDCSFHLFGSSVNGFGCKDSNINIDLEVPQGISPSKMLLKTYDALKTQENKYGNISRDFYVTMPCISFMDHKTKLSCEITLNNELSRKTSALLLQYAQFDDRARQLGIVLRIWAKICGIDQQDFCSLSPHCFPLMTIYFLQQTEPPVLPVLHEIVGEENVLTCDVKNSWVTRNKKTVAELWIDLLKFYATYFQYKSHVICIRQKQHLLCKEKKWTMRMMCIEDPYHTKRNLARTIANTLWYHYILECIRSTYEYFCTCKLPKGDILVDVGNSSDDEEEESCNSLEENSIDDFLGEQDNDLEFQSVVGTIKAMDLGDRTDGVYHKDHHEYMKHKDDQNENRPCNADDKECTTYKFERSHLINTKPPIFFCRQCQKSNHVKKNCPIDDNLPEMKKLPIMEKDHRDMLTEVCEIVFSFCSPTFDDIKQNEMLLFDLQRHIQYVFKDAQLELFGSSCNGFGFGDSDLDICLTFRNKQQEDFDQKDVIELLTRELNKYRKIRNILPIPTAKVPIIKFSFSGRKEGDISLYNTLGQHNTTLLSTYCKIDQRVQLLGYTLKYFAKKCDICDASRGSLSSYAYILMAIFYLQQLEIPVIPVLQELYNHDERTPERLVDSWNTWFFDDIDNLPSVWNHYGKNKQCLGELWMGLLIFYTEKFKVGEFVISIRQKSPLTRFEKLWNTRSIAIEDPFDHSHNLGAGVSGKMNSFILAAFRRGRELFGRTPPSRREIGNLLEYFFNTKFLTGGEKPPNERGCRRCSKIGHKIKECPLRRENFRRRPNFERRNNNADPKHGTFKNRADRNQGERQGSCNIRGMFRQHINFRNSHIDQREARRTVANHTSDMC